MTEQYHNNLPAAPLKGPWVSHVRVRLSHALTPSAAACDVEIAGRMVFVRSIDDGPLHSCPWVFLTIDGFISEAEARAWIASLRISMFAACAKTSLGVDFDLGGMPIFEPHNDPSLGATLSAFGSVTPQFRCFSSLSTRQWLEKRRHRRFLPPWNCFRLEASLKNRSRGQY